MTTWRLQTLVRVSSKPDLARTCGVRDGQTFIVTDRGEAVAELRPIGRGTSTAERLAMLTVKGAVTRQRSGSVSAFKPARVQKDVSASRAVTEDREDRF